MPLLRLEPTSTIGSVLHIEVHRDGGSERFDVPTDALNVPPEMHARMRWYFEDYPSFPYVPASRIAREIEAAMDELGSSLFQSLFQSNAAQGIWADVSRELADLEIEIITDAPGIDAIPWELLIAPHTDRPLSSLTRRFSRASRTSSTASRIQAVKRILLVIARPQADRDIAFRAIGTRILDALPEGHDLHIELLRPPTMLALRERLQQAAAEHLPFDLVHFDGHGVTDLGTRRTRLAFETRRTPTERDNSREELVRGSVLGGVLHELGVRTLIMNACRSSAAEALPPTEAPEEAHAPLSLAYEVLQTGVAAVVGMRFEVSPSAAADFVGRLYTALGDGVPVARAVTEARRFNATIPSERRYEWLIPTVHESSQQVDARLQPRPAASISSIRSMATTLVPRDALILRLERAFEESNVVHLHGLVGSGKSTTAHAFGTWLSRTGGTRQVHHVTVGQDADSMHAALVSAAGGIKPTDLWIIDRVELLAAASPVERAQVDVFLRERLDAGVRILLVGRQPEFTLGGERVRTVEVVPFAPDEQLELIRASLPSQTQTVSADVWRPLMERTRGNPATLRCAAEDLVAVGEASPEQMEILAAKVAGGSWSCVGLDPALESALTAAQIPSAQHPAAALLSLFGGRVSRFLLREMIQPQDPDDTWGLRALQALSAGDLDQMLQRLLHAGLLRRVTSSEFEAHPMLPRLLRPWFSDSYLGNASIGATRAYVGAVLSHNTTIHMADEDEHDVLRAMADHEQNLLRAFDLSLQNQWAHFAIELHRALQFIYLRTRQSRESHQLQAQLLASVFDAEGRLQPGYEDNAKAISFYCAEQDLRIGDIASATNRLQTLLAGYESVAVGDRPAMAGDPIRAWRHAQGRVAAVLEFLAHIRLGAGDPDCTSLYERALARYRAMEERDAIRAVLLKLGRAHISLGAKGDLARAQEAIEECRLTTPAHEPRGLSECNAYLARIAYLKITPTSTNLERDALLARARRYASDALILTPGAGGVLGVILHETLAHISEDEENWAEARHNYERAIGCAIEIDDFDTASGAQFQAARMLVAAGYATEARAFALAALNGFRGLGDIEAAEATQALLATI